jgi:hypothetical protein
MNLAMERRASSPDGFCVEAPFLGTQGPSTAFGFASLARDDNSSEVLLDE